MKSMYAVYSRVSSIYLPKKALLVTLLYTVVLMGSSPIRLPNRCSRFPPLSEPAIKPLPEREQPKLKACTVTIIPFFWHFEYQCMEDAFGGGGGGAF